MHSQDSVVSRHSSDDLGSQVVFSLLDVEVNVNGAILMSPRATTSLARDERATPWKAHARATKDAMLGLQLAALV